MFHKCFKYPLNNNRDTVNNFQSGREHRTYKKHILKYQKRINKHITFNSAVKKQRLLDWRNLAICCL